MSKSKSKPYGETVPRATGVVTVPTSSGSIEIPVLSSQGSLPRSAVEDAEQWLRYRCRIELAGQDELEGIVVAYPGTPLRVTIELEILEEVTLERCRARLRFRATGSGSPETHEFVRHTLLEGHVRAGRLIHRTLDMPLPAAAPISYEGTYVKIVWSVAVDFLAADGRMLEEEVPLVVRPRPVDWLPGDTVATVEAHTGELPEEPPQPEVLGTHGGEEDEPVPTEAEAAAELEVEDAPEPGAPGTPELEVEDAPDPGAPSIAAPETVKQPRTTKRTERVPDPEPDAPDSDTSPRQRQNVRGFYMGKAVTDDARVRDFYQGADEDDEDDAPAPAPKPTKKKPEPPR